MVIVCPNSARRDKQWNYIALEISRYTKHLQATGNLYERVDYTWGILNQKRMEKKDGFLGMLFEGQVSRLHFVVKDYKLTRHLFEVRLPKIEPTTN